MELKLTRFGCRKCQGLVVAGAMGISLHYVTDECETLCRQLPNVSLTEKVVWKRRQQGRPLLPSGD